MTYLVELTEQAEIELKTLFVAKNAAESKPAFRWFSALVAAIDSLELLPLRCPLAPESAELNMDLRQLLFGKKPHVYRIVYQIEESQRRVWVLSIRHGARPPLTSSDIS